MCISTPVMFRPHRALSLRPSDVVCVQYPLGVSLSSISLPLPCRSTVGEVAGRVQLKCDGTQ